MAEPCYEIETLGEIAELERGHPRRRHLEECPRCRARLAAYLEFMESPDLSRPDVAAAVLRLGVTVRSALAGAGAPASAPPARGETPSSAPRGPAPPAARAPSGLNRLAAWLRGPALRPVWAVGVLVVVSALVYLWFPRPTPTVLRGERPTGRLAVKEAVPEAGGVRLRWTSLPGADAYAVEIFSQDLVPLGRIGPVSDTTTVLEASSLAPAPGRGATLLWVVVALRGSDEIQRSDPGELHLP